MSMTRLGIARDEAALSVEDRQHRRETRSALLRLAVLCILVASLAVGEHGGNFVVHLSVVGGYALATAHAILLALRRHGTAWTAACFVVIDALAVVALFHEHLFGLSGSGVHALTTTSVAVAYLLLNHSALRLRSSLVGLYAGLVVIGWLSLLVLKGVFADWDDRHWLSVLASDATLAAAFAFAAFVAFLLIRDHNILLKSAVRSERRRLSLSRFFSPSVVADLQGSNVSIGLERRAAAVLFVDLRSFTRFSESAAPNDLAKLLIDYRTHVTQTVFKWDGTVDKFIGDGVMAVFGQPQDRPDDTERAVRCALHLVQVLSQWKSKRLMMGQPALAAGIGLHVGLVMGGVVESGQHHEFTVVGDTVNIAHRLERIAKTLGAALVVSAETLEHLPEIADQLPWQWKDDAQLEGREGTLRIAYLPHSHFVRVDDADE